MSKNATKSAKSGGKKTQTEKLEVSGDGAEVENTQSVVDQELMLKQLAELREALAASEAKNAELQHKEKQRQELEEAGKSLAPVGQVRIINVRKNEQSKSSTFPVTHFFDMLFSMGSKGKAGAIIRDCQACYSTQADKSYVNLPSRGGSYGYVGNLMGSDVVQRVPSRNSNVPISQQGMVLAEIVHRMAKDGITFMDVDVDKAIDDVQWDLISAKSIDGQNPAEKTDRTDELIRRAQLEAGSQAD